LRIAASQVVTPSGVIGPAAVEVEDGRIASLQWLEPGTGVADRVLVPGFVDIQVNGIADVDVATADGPDWERLDRLLLAQGVTTWCPTLVSSRLPSYGPALHRVAAAAHRRPGEPRPAIAGAHLEGPFLGGAPGAHPRDLLQPIDLGWLAELPPIVRVVTLAPELDRAIEAIHILTGRGVLVGLGHSTATYEQALAAADAGARLVTHLFNGMGPLHHRAPGLAGAALSDPRLRPSLIADLIHVHPVLLRLAFQSCSAVLVTDAVAWQAARVGSIGIAYTDGAPRLPDGTLAGSALTMDAAIRNVVSLGVPLATAVSAASTRPAELLGLADRGAIAPGQRADLVALSPELELEQVWIGGSNVAF
jgi:N-acetylglucosamine-6-phosphate deacetylase